MAINKMDISVIIPSYKPGIYISECIKSLVSQTLSPSRYEIIIILNGCNEPWYSYILSIANNYLSKYNLKILQTDEGGVSNARNIGINYANGEYVTFLDDDDYISPNYLKDLLNVSSINCVGISDSIYIDDMTGEYVDLNIHHKEYLKLHKINHPSLYSARRFFNGPVMKLLHKSIIGDRRFDINFKNGEDSLFMALISDKIKQLNFASNTAVYYRRIRENSATTSKRSKLCKMRNSLKLIKQYCIYWIRQPLKYNFKFMLSRILASLKI